MGNERCRVIEGQKGGVTSPVNHTGIKDLGILRGGRRDTGAGPRDLA